MRFSQRIGLTSVRESLQVNYIDEPLLNSLWNLLYKYHLEGLPTYTHALSGIEKNYIQQLWLSFYKKPLDEIPNTGAILTGFIKKMKRLLHTEFLQI